MSSTSVSTGILRAPQRIDHSMRARVGQLFDLEGGTERPAQHLRGVDQPARIPILQRAVLRVMVRGDHGYDRRGKRPAAQQEPADLAMIHAQNLGLHNGQRITPPLGRHQGALHRLWKVLIEQQQTDVMQQATHVQLLRCDVVISKTPGQLTGRQRHAGAVIPEGLEREPPAALGERTDDGERRTERAHLSEPQQPHRVRHFPHRTPSVERRRIGETQ